MCEKFEEKEQYLLLVGDVVEVANPRLSVNGMRGVLLSIGPFHVQSEQCRVQFPLTIGEDAGDSFEVFLSGDDLKLIKRSPRYCFGRVYVLSESGDCLGMYSTGGTIGMEVNNE